MIFVALSPLYIISASIVILMLVTAFFRNHKVAACLSILGIALAFTTIFHHCSCLPEWAWTLVMMDNTAWFFVGLTLASALFINIFSYYYFEKHDELKEEFYILFNTAILGTLVMVTYKHFISFFLGLELLSIPLYVMVAYTRKNPKSIEAAIKYLTLAGASTATMLFGMALLYAAAGSMDIYNIGEYFKVANPVAPYALAGIGLFITSIGFKLALAPFHMWSPHVYQGSPSPVTTFLATIAKAGVIVFVIRLFNETGLMSYQPAYYLLVILAVLSMFTGNLLALKEQNVKRILAFSSIAHMGYLLIALIIGGKNGNTAVMFYLASYFVTIIAAFGVISVLSGKVEPQVIANFSGLYFKKPLLAMTMAVAFLSLIGMPLTAGFMAKFQVAFASAGSKEWFLLWMLIINSIISIYYYLRVITVLFRKQEVEENIVVKVPILLSILLAIAILLIIWLGVAPGGLLSLL